MATFPQTQAPPEIVDVPLSLFGGMHCGANPADLPEGLSPDNQDVAFVPGAVFSRPGLSRLFAVPVSGAPALVYAKTYIQPDGDPLTLFMDANGKIYTEDVAENPGVYTQLAQVTAGLSAQSASAFGREYIAISDLLHGQWPPLQYDGTNLDRVTQDGPGIGPVCSNIAPATASIANSGPGTVYNIATLTPSDPVTHTNPHWGDYTVYTSLTVVTTAPNAIALGTVMAIAGVTPSSFNRTSTVPTAILNSTTFKLPYYSALLTGGAGGTATVQNPSLTRTGNIVTAITAAPHGFQVGWQVQIAIASVTIGGGIASISRDGNGVVTVTTTTPHGCPIGADIAIIGVTSTVQSFNGIFPIASVLTPTSFTYSQGGAAEVGGGSGNVQDYLIGTFFIQSIPSATSFTYQDIGPNDLTNATGTATIIGQISPGRHGVVQMFLTRQGAITKPSPPVFFDANGAQQMLVQGLAIGPPNVVARIIGLTGAGGDNYFVIPSIPQVGGQITGTSSLVPDNTTTSVVLDFSDNTLFAGIAIDQIGNDLFDQRVLIAPLGFYSYASRLICWGDYNTIQNLLNMTLAGGYTTSTFTAVAGSGSNSGSGVFWTNPNSAGSASAYADVSLTPGQISQQLFSEIFGLAVTGTPQQIAASFQYYYTASIGFAPAVVSVQLLKAGVAFGVPQTLSLPFPRAFFNSGSSASPLGLSLTFPVAGLLSSDINNSAFGLEVTVTANSNTVDFFVRNVAFTVLTQSALPLGWSNAASTGGSTAMVTSTLPGMYLQYQMTSAGGTNDCMISQPAFQDAFGTFILSPSTKYLLRIYAAYASVSTGSLVADFYSPSQGLLASASQPLVSVTAQAGFLIVAFSAATPIAIPSDTLLRLYLQSVTAGAVVTVGEMSLLYAQQSYENNLAFASYVVNPEGFSQTTGNIGSADDPSDIRCFSAQRNNTLLKTAGGTHIFAANTNEPDQWVVDNLSRTVGACSIRAGDPGQFGTGDAVEDWDITVNRNGWYLFAGGDFWRISQEISKGQGPQVTWDDINWAYQHTIWVKNDPSVHRVYAGVPVFGSTTPNLIFVLDYRELDTSTDMANAPALKIGLTGKMLSTDKTRKWTRHNVSANMADILVRPGNQKQMTFAGGLQNGVTYGNLYTLDPAKLTDDDYGAIVPYYDTYFFVNHEQEQMLGLGTGRKLTRKISGFITGVGYVSIIPLVDSMQNPLPATSPRLLSLDTDPSNLVGQDLEWTVGIRGERQAFRIQVQPLLGSTDVQLKIQKLIVSMMKDPVTTYRGSVL
jgi:hypothetical protein